MTNKEPAYFNLKFKYDGPPYMFKALVNGKWRKMMGFDEDHIQNQLAPKKAKKIIKLKDD